MNKKLALKQRKWQITQAMGKLQEYTNILGKIIGSNEQKCEIILLYDLPVNCFSGKSAVH